MAGLFITETKRNQTFSLCSFPARTVSICRLKSDIAAHNLTIDLRYNFLSYWRCIEPGNTYSFLIALEMIFGIIPKPQRRLQQNGKEHSFGEN